MKKLTLLYYAAFLHQLQWVFTTTFLKDCV